MRWGKRTPWFPRIIAAHRFLSVSLLKSRQNRSASEFSVFYMERLEKVSYETWSDQKKNVIEYYPVEKILVPDLRVQRIMRMLQRNFSYDMHSGNVMCRGKQLVITDPFCCFRNNPAAIRN